jgi:hypothetical protein
MAYFEHAPIEYYGTGAPPTTVFQLGQSPVMSPTEGWIRTAAIAAAAYHGYKRSGKVSWTIVWAFFGGVAPIITLPVAAAQGFAKPKR